MEKGTFFIGSWNMKGIYMLSFRKIHEKFKIQSNEIKFKKWQN